MRSSGEFTQAVIQVADVRVAVEAMRGRGVVFEKYDTPETRDRERNCTDAGWRRGGLVQGLGRQFGRRRSRPCWLETEELRDPEGPHFAGMVGTSTPVPCPTIVNAQLVQWRCGSARSKEVSPILFVHSRVLNSSRWSR